MVSFLVTSILKPTQVNTFPLGNLPISEKYSAYVPTIILSSLLPKKLDI